MLYFQKYQDMECPAVIFLVNSLKIFENEKKKCNDFYIFKIA